MPAAPLPDNEDRRLATLRRLQVLDSSTEAAFDRITRLTSLLLDAPIAVISLVDERREWFKACVGTDQRQADRTVAFCAHAILSDEVLVVEDALQDDRFLDNPQVTTGGIRFYAGAPLHTGDGVNIGALCVKDVRPRTFPPEHRQLLEHLAAIVVDELELRTGNERYRATEQVMQSVLDSSLDGIMAFDALRGPSGGVTDFRWTLVNRQAEQMTGRRSDELIGRRMLECMPGNLSDGLFARYVHVVETGQPAKFEHHYAHDGVDAWFSISAVKLGDGFAVTFADVTQRKRAENARDRFFRLSLDMLCILARDGTFRQVNPAWTTILGHDRLDLIGRRFTELVHQEDRPTVRAAATRLAEGQPVNELQCRMRCADGTYRWLMWNAQPQGTQTFAVARDVTERRRAEQTMREARDQAEAAREAQSQFLANMSHEIRTPMNAIIGMTELVLDTQLTDEQRDCLELVHSSAESLLDVLNDVLDFSKIEAGMLELSPVPFRLRDVIGDTLQTLAVRSSDAGLELLNDIAPDVPDHLVGDPGRLRQVLVNLVGNAVKFTERGEIVAQVRLEAIEDGEAVIHVEVRDTGIGIPADKLDVIFEGFRQADGSTTREYGGTGLGLPISAQIVSMMGGRLWVESEPGVGSRFHFTVRMGINDDADEAAECPDLRDLPVLVVDDNGANRFMLERLLRSWLMRPDCVDCGAAALERLAAADAAGTPFELILLDCHMPGMDGFTLAETIRRDVATSPRMVMLTSGASPGDVARCREIGIDGYTMKPIKQSELLATIVAALRGVPRRCEPAALPVEAASTRPLRVLLVEDNVVNQKLAMRMLERRGHHVEIAGNGQEALDRLEAERFDIVLMDVQMPVMDGLTAAAEIRRREPADRHVPIIAMTAHAMKGDRERCLASGMDEYVSKPINAGRLLSLVEALADPVEHRPTTEPSESPPVATADTSPVLASDELLERVGGSLEVLEEVLGIFREESEALMQRVRESVERGDAETLHDAAHSLKGALANLAAAPAERLARELEALADDRDLARAAELVAALQDELDRLEPALSALAMEATA